MSANDARPRGSAESPTVLPPPHPPPIPGPPRPPRSVHPRGMLMMETMEMKSPNIDKRLHEGRVSQGFGMWCVHWLSDDGSPSSLSLSLSPFPSLFSHTHTHTVPLRAHAAGSGMSRSNYPFPETIIEQGCEWRWGWRGGCSADMTADTSRSHPNSPCPSLGDFDGPRLDEDARCSRLFLVCRTFGVLTPPPHRLQSTIITYSITPHVPVTCVKCK